MMNPDPDATRRPADLNWSIIHCCLHNSWLKCAPARSNERQFFDGSTKPIGLAAPRIFVDRPVAASPRRVWLKCDRRLNGRLVTEVWWQPRMKLRVLIVTYERQPGCWRATITPKPSTKRRRQQ